MAFDAVWMTVIEVVLSVVEIKPVVRLNSPTSVKST